MSGGVYGRFWERPAPEVEPLPDGRAFNRGDHSAFVRIGLRPEERTLLRTFAQRRNVSPTALCRQGIQKLLCDLWREELALLAAAETTRSNQRSDDS